MQRQLVRFTLVGLASNAVLYLLYLALTRSLLAPMQAMTVVYVAGVGIGFLGNRHWTFRYLGPTGSALARYVFSYVAGYGVNFLGLYVGVDMLAWPHEIVQAILIVLIALLMFAMQRYYVFPEYRRTQLPTR